LIVVLLTAALGMLAGCAGPGNAEPAQAATTAAVDAVQPSAGPRRTVLLDPGHNGGNASHLAQINRRVPDGRGGTKACNTTGTATDDGFTEHEFAIDVALEVRDLLRANGVNVVLTRTDDDGVGPCVDQRGRAAAKANADLAVSIHADGAPASGHGFHVIYPKPPLNAAQGKPSLDLATDLRNALREAGLPVSTYVGTNGLDGRSDLAGLNLSTRPVAMVECANMRNPREAMMVSNGAGQARYAQAITIGILNWLTEHPVH
jgi:N-acetylmuramoyl-L-alanine amidase